MVTLKTETLNESNIELGYAFMYFLKGLETNEDIFKFLNWTVLQIISPFSKENIRRYGSKIKEIPMHFSIYFGKVVFELKYNNTH